MKTKITSFALLASSFIFAQTLDTQIRDNAGAPTTQSGFYQTENPVNYPNGATSFWHLLDVRHTNPVNNYGMQFAGSFFDQELWFRKTNNSATTSWSKVVLENPAGNVGIGTNSPATKLEISTDNQRTLLNFNNKSAISFLPNNGNSWFHISHGLNNDLVISQGGNVDFGRLVTIKNGGNMGIGVSNPSERLDVLETIALSAVNYQQGNRIDSKWVFATRGDGTAMFLAPRKSDDTGWDYTKQTIFKDGNIALSGKLEAKEIKVTLTPTADFVFEENYDLPKLKDVEKFIKENKHLPEIASAKVMEKEGVNVGEFQIKLLQKIEELTLYVIEQQKKIETLENKLSDKK